MADPLSLAVLSVSITGLLMRGAAVAVDPSWGSAASLPGDALNAWRSLRRLQQGRGGQENPLEASVKARLQKQVDAAGERYERTGVSRSALAGAVTEMEVALKELSGDDAAVLEAVRFPDNFERYLRRRAAGRRQNVEAAAEPFFDDLTRIVAEEFIYQAPGSRAFDITALKQLLAGQERLVAGQEQLLEGQAETNELLGAMDTDIKEIHSAVTRNQSISPKRIHFGYRPRVITGFVKREEQDKLFEAVLTCAEPRTVLTGMRGSGKTQLAATVATRCEEEGWPLVAWIDADSRDTLIANLYNLALQAGIEAPKDVPPETIVRRFLDQLHSADAADRLFVFDNVENLDDLRGLTPEGNRVRALITTTRHLDWDSLGWLPLTVGVFERDQSINLLCERTGDNHRNAADQIAEALGDLPVAVSQAAALAKSRNYPLSEYLDRLNNHPLEVSISHPEGGDYRDTVGIALFMAYEQTLDQLKSNSPQQEKIAISLLDTLSLLSASGVPTHWLLAINNNSDAVRDTLSFLRGSSILQESTDGNKTIIHRLQGQIYRETYLSNQEKFSEARTHATTILNKVEVESLDNFEEQRQEVQDLIEQVRSVTSQDHSYPLFSDPTFVSAIAMALWRADELGMPQLALTLTDSITHASDILGSEHPHVLTARNNLAESYRASGSLDKAIELHQQVLEIRSHILGPDHLHVLTSRNNLASAYQAAGQLDQAVSLYQQNLEDLKTLQGPNHPYTLSSRNNLASAYQAAGQLDQAIALYESTLNAQLHTLGHNHPHTLSSRNNLASAYQAAGQLDQAISLYQQNLEDLKTLQGPNHPYTLSSRNNLASAYQAAGQLDQAIALYESTLNAQLHTLGPDHPNTLASRNNLANTYQAAGYLDKAIELHQHNLKYVETLHGPNHPYTLSSRNNLASTYQAAGQLDQAIALYESTLNAQLHTLGPNHPHTLITRINIASTYQAAGQLDEAVKLHEQNLADSIRILGLRHPYTLNSCDNLAYAYQDAGRLAEAISLFEQNLEDRTRTLGPHHPDTLTSRNNLANAYKAAHSLDAAITLHLQNLANLTRILGSDHPHTLISRNNLAGAYRAAGRADEAEALFETPSDSEDEQDGTEEDPEQEAGD